MSGECLECGNAMCICDYTNSNPPVTVMYHIKADTFNKIIKCLKYYSGPYVSPEGRSILKFGDFASEVLKEVDCD